MARQTFKFSFNKDDLRDLSNKLAKLGKFDGAARRALYAGAGELYAETKERISSTNYTLAMLEALNHPYARRHGSIQVNPGEEYLVNVQSGQMRDSFRKTEYADAVDIGWDSGSAPPYVAHVLGGTKKMLGRDVLQITADDPDVQQDMDKAAVKSLRRSLKDL